MAKNEAHINHEILKWARERMGYSLEEAQNMVNKKLPEWEKGTLRPTYNQLDVIAKEYFGIGPLNNRFLVWAS